MTLNLKPQASNRQIITFGLCGVIGLCAITRNVVRMHRYERIYKAVMGALEKYRHNFAEIQKIKSQNIKQMALLEAVFPNFPSNYFKNTTNPAKYKTSIGKFYEELECDSGFEGVLRGKDKEHSIYLEMNRPSVGFEIAQNALKFDERGIKFHRDQMIAVYGELSYSKESKRYIMKAKLLGLDSIEIIKFTQMRLIATIFSTLYFSILLGISLSLWRNVQLLEPTVKLGSEWLRHFA